MVAEAKDYIALPGFSFFLLDSIIASVDFLDKTLVHPLVEYVDQVVGNVRVAGIDSDDLLDNVFSKMNVNETGTAKLRGESHFGHERVEGMIE